MNIKMDIPANEALSLIKSGKPLKNCAIYGEFNLDGLDHFGKKFIAQDCIFESLSGVSSFFSEVFDFTNCQFKKCSFTFSYFLGGLNIDHCIFENYLDFQAGGHNKNESIVSIKNSVFKGFVNFFDCWYEGPIIVKDNDFKEGTNLLGSAENLTVAFDVKPLIENNNGKLDIDGEGFIS